MKINFGKVRYKNILSTGNTFTEIDLQRSKSTLIIGRNGSGKSTIIEAIIFALFGTSYRDINKGQLVNSINKKDLVVELEFEVGGMQYKVRRGIKPNIFEIYRDGQLVDQASDVREYQNYLEKQVLRQNYSTFTQVSVIGSAAYQPFMKLKPQQRREVIEGILDTEIYSVMSALLKDRAKENKRLLGEFEKRIAVVDGKIEVSRRMIAQAKQDSAMIIDQKKTKIEEYISRREVLFLARDELQGELAALKEQLAVIPKLQKRITQMTEIERDLERKKSTLQGEIKFFQNNDNCPTCKQDLTSDFKDSCVAPKQRKMTEIIEAMMELENQLADENAKLKELDAPSKRYGKAEQELSSIKNDILLQDRLINTLKDEVATLESKQKEDPEQDSKLREFLEEKQQIEEELVDLVDQRGTYDQGATILKDDGVKASIVKLYIPKINEKINGYLADMGFSVSFELNENFEETIKSRHRDDFTYASFSEGEKMRLDLAMLFAWREIARLRNSTSTNLLFLDETFDSSLDDAGSDDFLRILNAIEDGTHTFVITHKSQELMDKFRASIRFEKIGGFSTIVE